MLLTHYFLSYILGNKYTYLGGVVCLQRSRDITWNTNDNSAPRNQVSIFLPHPTQCPVLQIQSHTHTHKQKQTNKKTKSE